MSKVFGILFILTGIFALVGGIYTWGDGSLLNQTELIKLLIPWADIILTGPLSLVAGIGILKRKYWGPILGLAASGIYIFGSILVFITINWSKDYSFYLIVPASSGMLIGLGYIIQMIGKRMQ